MSDRYRSDLRMRRGHVTPWTAPMPRLTADDLARLRRTLCLGDQLDAAIARRLMDEIEATWADLAGQRVEFAHEGRGGAGCRDLKLRRLRRTRMPRPGRSRRS